MSITPVQSHPASPERRSMTRRSSPQASPQASKGLAEVPDRLEPARARKEEGPPSQFKKFLIDPAIQTIKWFLRGIFHFIDWLKSFAFDEEPDEPDNFLSQLRAAPRVQEILFQFEQCFSSSERDEIYRSIGEKYPGMLSWKERFWNRSAQENIDLGKRLVAINPERIRDRLANRLASLKT